MEKKKECQHVFEYIPLGVTYQRDSNGRVSGKYYNASEYLKACTKCVYAETAPRSDVR